MEEVYCTMLLTDGYLPGVQVLAHSLRDGGATRKLAVLATQEFLSEATMKELNRLYDFVIPVDRITNRSHGNLLMMDRLDLSSAFTKIHLWRMTQFSKIVYIDADVVALRAPEELFDTKEKLAACPDIGWPDCFNSGVMVLKPDMGTFHGLKNLAQRGISFDGADQGLLNQYFRDWHRLSFVYNVTPSGHYQYVPAYNHYRSSITMAHFIGAGKPWVIGRSVGEENPGTPYGEMLGRWWSTWDTHYRPLTEQDPALAWVTPSKSANAPRSIAEIKRPNPMPTEYDPNFRREHVSFDDRAQDQAAVWHPPSGPQEHHQHHEQRHEQHHEQYHERRHEHQYHQEHHQGHHQEHHHQPAEPQYHPHGYQAHQEPPAEVPPPPVFLPREHVPYVPREMPYTAYSQTQAPPSYEPHQHHQEHHQQHHHQEQHYQPPPPQHQEQHTHVHAPQPVHHQWQEQGRRFSQEIPDRIENSLPLPPLPPIGEHHEPPRPEPPVFEAPMQQWNAERFSPPPNSRPEAHNWPSQTYENKWDQEQQDTALFVPPRVASPPRNLHFELPPKPNVQPKPAPIFPWEHREIPRATRVFAGDFEETQEPTPEPSPEATAVEDEYETEEASGGYDTGNGGGGMAGWDSYSRSNAWDSIPEIERYVASFQRYTNPQHRRSVRKGDMTPNPTFRSSTADPENRDANNTNEQEEEEEMLSTTIGVLPPEISVTPTPFKSMRGYRSSAMDDESKFPSAKGIPDQQNWDPWRSLQELKNAPGELLNRSPPSPESLTRGSPRSPASSVLVSSSMPVPEKEFHITAYQRRHEMHHRHSESSGASSMSSSPVSTFQPHGVDGPWRPKPRRYTTSSTQTDTVETSDAETQSDPEDIDAEMEALSVA